MLVRVVQKVGREKGHNVSFSHAEFQALVKLGSVHSTDKLEGQYYGGRGKNSALKIKT